MNEQLPNTGEALRTIAIRVTPELRDQFDAVLEITGMSVNGAGTEALEGWIAGKLLSSVCSPSNSYCHSGVPGLRGRPFMGPILPRRHCLRRGIGEFCIATLEQ